MAWQPATITPPDAEAFVITHLAPLLAAHGETAPGHRRVPANRPPRFWTVNRDGGAFNNFRDIARLRIRTWDADYQAANAMARLVIAVLPAMPGVLHVEHLSGPLEVPDESAQACCYSLVEVHLRGTPPLT